MFESFTVANLPLLTMWLIIYLSDQPICEITSAANFELLTVRLQFSMGYLI